MLSHAPAQPAPSNEILEDFGVGWESRWKPRRFLSAPTLWQATGAGLRAEAKAAGSGIFRRIQVANPGAVRLRWRWHVAAPLSGLPDERTRAGDDFAARCYVVFDDALLPSFMRALCYVWAGRLPVGSTHPSPYAAGVRIIVLRSGPGEAGRWLTEERDVYADYLQAFGEPPRSLEALGLMTDSDNTGQHATAGYGALHLEWRR